MAVNSNFSDFLLSQTSIENFSPSEDVEQEIKKYGSYEIETVNSFIRSRGIQFTRNITVAEYQQAEYLGAGVAGAKKITLGDGITYVVKAQLFTETFRKNYYEAVRQNKPIEHSIISESHDSFAHFPRKEVIGYELSHAYNLRTPKTELITIDQHYIASLQEFIPSDQATVMNKKGLSIQLSDIEMTSAVKTFMCQQGIDNIDGHTGNVMLWHLPQSDDSDSDDDSFTASYEAFPIDFGLIHPRLNGVQPREGNKIKQGIYKLVENRTINFASYGAMIPDSSLIDSNPALASLMTDHEKINQTKNLRAQKETIKILSDTGERVSVAQYNNLFVERLGNL